jgi:hypothetical protein
MKRFAIETERERHFIEVIGEIADNPENFQRKLCDWPTGTESGRGYWAAKNGGSNGGERLRFNSPAFLKLPSENHGARAEIAAPEPAGTYRAKEFLRTGGNQRLYQLRSRRGAP